MSRGGIGSSFKSQHRAGQIALKSKSYLNLLTDVGGDSDVKNMKKKYPIKSTERDATAE